MLYLEESWADAENKIDDEHGHANHQQHVVK